MTNSEKMLACLDRQDLAGADKCFKRALDQDDQEVLLELGEYLEAIGFYPQAKLVYERLAATYPHVNLSLAQIASEDGETEAAFAYLSQISEDSEDYVTALLVMADLYDAEGLTDVARDKLLLASQLSSEPLVTFGLAELELALEDYQAAIDHYALLDNRDILAATGISTYERIGRAYANLGKLEAATQFLEKALEIEHDDQTLFELSTLYFEQEDYQRACLSFKQLETLSPDFAGYEYVYALALQADHQGQEALRLAQQGLRKNQFDGQLLLLASQLAYEAKDGELAEAYLKQVLALDAEDQEGLFRLANLYLETERYEEVVGLGLEQTARPLTLWLLAQAHKALDQEEEALALYDSLKQDLADNPEFLLDYGQTLRSLGDWRVACQVLETYLTLVPDDEAVADQVAELERELGHDHEHEHHDHQGHYHDDDDWDDDEDWSHPCACCLGHDR